MKLPCVIWNKCACYLCHLLTGRSYPRPGPGFLPLPDQILVGTPYLICARFFLMCTRRIRSVSGAIIKFICKQNYKLLLLELLFLLWEDEKSVPWFVVHILCSLFCVWCTLAKLNDNIFSGLEFSERQEWMRLNKPSDDYEDSGSNRMRSF